MENIFKENPSLDVVYKTSDNRFFYLETDAKNYAKGLENKKVEKLERTKSAETETKKVVKLEKDGNDKFTEKK